MFDLRDVDFISSAALVELAAAAHAVKQSGETLRIIVESDSVRTYLARAGFLPAVSGAAIIEPEYDEVAQHRFDHLVGSNPLLLEVTRLETGAALPPLLDQIVELLRSKFRYRKTDAYDVATVISEVAQNTFDHNTGSVGFLALQVYEPRGKGKRRFAQIGISDYGAGVLATLRRNPRFARLPDDRRAIKAATQLGVSQHANDQTRGTGLHHLLRIAYEHQGSVQIRSGAGKVSYRGDRRHGYDLNVPRMPGVQIEISLPRRA